jgi:hypothetical protein
MEIGKFGKKCIDVSIGENDGMKRKEKGLAYLCGWLLPSSVTMFACTPPPNMYYIK